MDGRRKHKTETRIEAARLFDAGFGHSAVASLLKIPKGTSRQWFDSHRNARLLGLGFVSGNKHYSFELKLAAVEKFIAGSTKAEVLFEFDISTRALFNKWLASYRLHGVDGLKSKARGRPKRTFDPMLESDAEKIWRLEMEIEVLKKLIALTSQEEEAQLAKRKLSRH
jgi:transposase